MAAKIPARFTNADAARKHLENLLWKNGRPCPHCGVLDDSTALQGKSTRPGVYWCNACQKPFSVTVGTVMERSHIPLNIWLYANHLLNTSKKGISSHQLARMLGVSYKSAWFLSHRIREAMAPASGAGPVGGEGKIVEADETEISPSVKSRPRARGKNMRFVTLIERDGKVRSKKITGTGEPIGWTVQQVIYKDVSPDSTLHTDSARHYTHAMPKGQHEAVNHNKEYVRTKDDGSTVHVNTAEGFFSVFKRGLVGTYQHMGEQHLQRYLAEFDFRMTHRAKLGFDDATRADIALQGIVGKRLTYRRTLQAADA